MASIACVVYGRQAEVKSCSTHATESLHGRPDSEAFFGKGARRHFPLADCRGGARGWCHAERRAAYTTTAEGMWGEFQSGRKWTRHSDTVAETDGWGQRDKRERWMSATKRKKRSGRQRHDLNEQRYMQSRAVRSRQRSIGCKKVKLKEWGMVEQRNYQ